MAKGNPAKGGGVEVARLTVKVSPDTKMFKRELENQLQRINKAVDGDDTTDISMGADTKQMTKQVKKATQNLSADVEIGSSKTSLDRFQRRQLGRLQNAMSKIEVTFDLDEAGERLRRRLDMEAGKVSRLASTGVPLEPQHAADWRAKVDKLVGEVNDYADRRKASLKFEPMGDQQSFNMQTNMLKFIQKLKDEEAEDERRNAQALAQMHKKLQNDKHQQRIDDWKDELKHMKMREDETRKFMTQFNKDNPPITLQLDQNFDYKLRQRLDKIKPKIPVQLDVDTKSFSSKLGGMKAPSFGSGINPSGYLLIAAGIAAITPLISGALGMLTTALLALPGLIALVAVPIAALTLGIDGFKKAAEVLKAPFDDLKASMSAKVEEQFTPVFKQLGEIFPTLKAALPTVTQGMADMAKSMTDVLTSPEGAARIDTIIRNIGSALTAMAPGIGSFTDGFTKLIEGFTTNLPGIAKWVNDTGKSFSDWVTDFTTKGPDGTSKFDRALGNLGDSLKEIGGGLVKIGGKALDFFSDPEKIKSFKAELEGLVDMILAIVDGINGLSSMWSKINPGFADGEASGIMDFMPIQIQKIKEAFDGIDWSGIWDGMKNAASTAFEFIKTVFTPLGTFIGAVFNQIAAIAAPVWGVISTMAQTTWSVISAVWSGAVAFFSGVFSSLSTVAVPVWDAIKSGASSAWGVIQSVWSGFASFFSGLWNGLVGIVSSVWESVKSAVQSACTAIIGFVTSMGSGIVSAIQSIDLAAAGRAIMDGLLGGIKAGAEKVYNFVKGIADKIAALKGPLPYDRKVLIPNGEALMDGLDTGLQSGLTGVLETAKSIAGEIQKAMDAGTDGTSMFSDLSTDDLKQYIAAIEEEKKRLKIEKNAIPKEDKEGRNSLQNQIDQLQAQKDILGYQKDRVKNEEDYGNAAGDDPLVKAAAGLAKAPVDFAKATAGQFMSDLGVSGDGLISRAVTEGISYIFQIGSVDQAMGIKDREDSKRARAAGGR